MMENPTNPVRLFGAHRCYKSEYYADELRKRGVEFEYHDVEQSEESAPKLRALYDDGGLKFPTLTIGDKRLRNPRIEDLEKWLERKAVLPPTLRHDPARKIYFFLLEQGEATIRYQESEQWIALEAINSPPSLEQKLVHETISKLKSSGKEIRIRDEKIERIAQNLTKSQLGS